jgi:hypothetical protein
VANTQNLRGWALAAGLAALLGATSTAQAADTWTTPFAGVKRLHRTGPDKLNIEAAVIDLCAAGVSVRHTAFEERQKKTSSFAAAVGAQVAINADFSCRPIDIDPVKSPFKPCVNKPAYVTYGIAAHAGVPWPQTLSKDALLAFGTERAEMWDDAQNKDFDPAWMQEVLSGHWSLVIDGKLTGADCPIDPRTGVGLSADGNKLMLIVVDGRNGWRGMTCVEMAQVLIELGADRAFNLDGGGSSTFWQQGQGVLNHPSDGVERVVGPHLAIYAKGGGPAPHCERPSVVDPGYPLPAYQPLGPPAWLQAVQPQRVFDTRKPASSAPLQGLVKDAQGRMVAGSSANWGDAQLVPAGASAVVLNLAAAEAASAGYLTAWSGAAPMPNVSILNYDAAAAAANMGPVRLGAKGTVAVYTHATSHVIGDFQGVFAQTGAGFSAASPYRALDTRDTDKPLLPGQPRKIIDADPALHAVALAVTAVTPMYPGFMRIYPCDQAAPETSNVNFAQGENRAAAVLAPMGLGGICAVSSVPSHLVVDVFGSFAAGKGSPWQAVAPVRLIDTRLPAGRWTGKVQPGKELELRFADMPGFPADAVGVSFNLTAVAPRSDGFLAFGPCGKPAATSNLNFREHQTVASAAWMGLGPKGALCLKAGGRSHVVVDLTGVFLAVPPPPPPPPVDTGAGELDAGPSSSDASAADASASETSGGETSASETSASDVTWWDVETIWYIDDAESAEVSAAEVAAAPDAGASDATAPLDLDAAATASTAGGGVGDAAPGSPAGAAAASAGPADSGCHAGARPAPAALWLAWGAALALAWRRGRRSSRGHEPVGPETRPYPDTAQPCERPDPARRAFQM